MKAQGYTPETILGMGLAERTLLDFRAGDTIQVSERIKEGDKERIQTFEGDVIALHKCGIASTITVRRIGANAVSVERVFPLHSEKFSFAFVREGAVRRAKLYYMRARVGKQARVQEKPRTQIQKNKLATRLANVKQAASIETAVAEPTAVETEVTE